MVIKLLIIYLFGFFLSIYLLKKYGKSWGVDYFDEPKTYVNYDDYESNASAYLSWSLFWFILGPLVLIFFGYNKLVELVKIYLEK